MIDAFKRAMESRSARDAVTSAVRLGLVYLESDSYTDALGYFLQASEGDLASQLTARESAALYLNIARCHLGLGQYEEARSCRARIDELDLAEADEPIAAEADVVIARAEIESGRYQEALRAAQRAYEVLRTRPDGEALAEAGKALGIANAELGNIQAARDYFTDYLVTQKRLKNEAGLASAYNNLGILAKRSGDLHGGLEYIENALAIDRRLGHAAVIADRLTNIGIILYKLSRWAEAEERLNEAREIYSRIGATRGLVAVGLTLGNLCRIRREWGRAREHFDRSLRASREHGYLRAEALALEYTGHLEIDRGSYEDGLGTLDRALACAYRLGTVSDVVGEVLRRRAEALYALGRLEEAERDCAEGLKVCREIGDHFEEGVLLRVLASICYAKGEQAAAEVLINQSEETLRRIGDDFELARVALADGVGLRELASPEEIALDRVEARFSAAEARFTRIGAGAWVARCQFERAKALRKGGRVDSARSWLERSRLKYEVGHDLQGLAEVDALLSELDAELAYAGASQRGRYMTITSGYSFLETAEPHADDLHRFAEEIAGAVPCDRLALFEITEDGSPMIATSVDRSGGGVAEVARFVRSKIATRGYTRPLVVSDGRSSVRTLPQGCTAVGLIPIQVGLERDRDYLIYVDRAGGPGSAAFAQSDVEFIGAAARMLAQIHLRVCESAAWRRRGDLVRELRSTLEQCGFITRDPQMLAILASVERLRESRVPVVIRGESGVGKDLIARAIHEGGRSRTGRFVALNAGAIAPHLQESELFGHVKGAFTDADRDREGLVAAANDGTLFLDEIGEMSKELQVKLLRFLQNGEYRRVGESVTRTSNARVISATNKDLSEEVRADRFRRDLFYRLCTVVIEVPPLRDRPDDIPLLMEHFLELYSKREAKRIGGFSRDVRELFMRHDWRGNNVRELENAVRRGVALCAEGDVIGIDKLSPELAARYQLGGDGGEPHRRSLRDEIDALEKTRILEALDESGWNKKRASERLGISRTGLLAKMKKHGIG